MNIVKIEEQLSQRVAAKVNLVKSQPISSIRSKDPFKQITKRLNGYSTNAQELAALIHSELNEILSEDGIKSVTDDEKRQLVPVVKRVMQKNFKA